MKKITKAKILIILGLTLMVTMNTYSQTDTVFWFVAPGVEKNHGDSPIKFRISTSTSDATVTISQPANTSSPVSATFTVSAGNTHSVDLSLFLNYVENTPENTVLQKGIKISSTSPITAYYEVANGVNPEIFPLKGQNAFGREFYVPSQTKYYNGYNTKESVDIVATQNNTTVIIDTDANLSGTTSKNIIITLNKGETYNIRAANHLTSTTLAGTHITSNKAICVTISDDSVQKGGARDLLGDQLIPVDMLGNKYIAVRGLASSDEVFVQATHDNTEVFIKGRSTPETVLNKGEHCNFTIDNSALLVETSEPSYMYHMSGHGDEYGSAILPQISCTGSRFVGFVRSSHNDFYLIILTPKGNEGNFYLNGDNSLIKASHFSEVEGSSGKWMSARIPLTTSQLSVGNNVLSNSTGIFHLGILNKLGPSSEYGYFSNYSTFSLGSDLNECAYNDIFISAGVGRDSYLWSTGETSSSIRVTQTGNYWVRITEGECTMSDTIHIQVNDLEVDLGNDTVLCENTPLTLSVDDPGLVYHWSTGELTQSISVNNTGQYHVAVQDTLCIVRDTINVEFRNLNIDIGNDKTLCNNQTTNLSVNRSGLDYLWSTGETSQSVTVGTAGKYFVTAKDSYCEATDSITITSHTLTVDIGNDTTLCNDETITLTVPHSGLTYNWSDGGTGQSKLVSTPGIFWVEVDDGICRTSDSITVNYTLVSVDLGNDTILCNRSSFPLKVSNPGLDYLWSTGESTQSITVNNSGEYIAIAGLGSCRTSDTINIDLRNLNVHLGSDTTLCQSQTITLSVPENGVNYNWSTGANTQSINISSPGDYAVSIRDGVCSNSDTIKIEYEIHSFKLGNDTILCNQNRFNISAPTGFNTYRWLGGETTESITALSSGAYRVDATSDHCLYSDSINVDFRSVVANLGNDTTLCNNDILPLTAETPGINYFWQDGSRNRILPVSVPGIYHVYISDGICTDTDSIRVAYEYINLDIGNDTTLCNQNQFTIRSNESGLNYLWSNRSSQDFININSSGEYILSANSNHCSDKDTINVTFRNFNINLGADTVLCNNSTLRLELNPPATSYLWSNRGTGDHLIVNNPGIYSLTAFDGICYDSDTISIDYEYINLDIGNDTTLCNQNQITIRSNESGLNYLWSNGSSQDFININSSGEYILSANSNHCNDKDTVNVNFRYYNINIGNDTILCNDDSLRLQLNSSALTYQWSDGSNLDNIMVNMPGIYSLTASDGVCYDSDSITINYNILTLDLGRDTILCNKPDFNLKISKPNLAYSWSTGSNSQNITVNQSGNYSATVSDKFCTVSDNINIEFRNFNFSLGNDINLCNTAQHTITPNVSRYNYTWFDGDNTLSKRISSSGLYWIEGTDGICTMKDTVNVNFENISVNLGKDSTMCFNTTINISPEITSNVTNLAYKWSDNSNNKDIAINSSGQYWMEAYSPHCSSKDTVLISMRVLNVDAGNDTTLCNSDKFKIEAITSQPFISWSTGESSNTIVVDKTGEYIIKVSDGVCMMSDTIKVEFEYFNVDLGKDSIVCNSDLCMLQPSVKGVTDARFKWSNNVNTESLKITKSGKYWVKARTRYCASSDTVDIEFRKLSVNIGKDTTICNGESCLLIASTDNLTYNWSNGASTKSILISNSGDYTLSANDQYCIAKDTISINFVKTDIELGADTTLCDGESIILKADKSVERFTWNNNLESEHIEVSLPGTYILEYYKENCYGSDTIEVNFSIPFADIGNDTSLCVGNTVKLSSKFDSNKYEWSDGSNSRTIDITETGEYTLKTYDKYNCVAESSVYIEFNDLPEIVNIDTNTYEQFVIDVESGTEPYQYSLDNNNYQNSNILKCKNDTWYDLYVKDANNCITMATVKSKKLIKTFNFFTPNGDGENENWTIEGIEDFPNADIKIFDRNGTLLASYKGYEPGWNGTVLGEIMPSDDYWYVIELHNGDDPYVGHFSLKR